MNTGMRYTFTTKQRPLIYEIDVLDNDIFALQFPSNVNQKYSVQVSDGRRFTNLTELDSRINNEKFEIPFGTGGTYQIYITGSSISPYFGNGTLTNVKKLKKILQWGDIPKHRFERAFIGCSNLDVFAEDTLVVRSTANSDAFNGCTNLFMNTLGPLDWVFPNNSNMSKFFRSTPFNNPINHWQLTPYEIAGMFRGAFNFNQPLDQWDLSSCGKALRCFQNASSFNQDISGWQLNFSGNYGLRHFFQGASSFNQDISGWNVSLINDMAEMFRDASSFNQDLSNWCVEQIPTEPSNFSFGSPLLSSYHPNWGVNC